MGNASFSDMLNANFHIVTGSIDATNGTDAVLSNCNDGSATLTRNATGDYTVTFGHAFTTTPFATAAVISATAGTAATDSDIADIHVDTVATNSVRFGQYKSQSVATLNGDLVEQYDFNFMVFGRRLP